MITVHPLQPAHSPSPPSPYTTQPLLEDIADMTTRRFRPTRFPSVVDSEEEIDDLDRFSLGSRDDTSIHHSDFRVKEENDIDEVGDDGLREGVHRQSRRLPATTATTAPPALQSHPQGHRARTTSSGTLSGRAATPPSSPAVPRKVLRASHGKHQHNLRGRSTAPQARLGDVGQQAGHGLPGRALRKRTIQQTHPFKFEKHQHNLAKSKGTDVEVEAVEQAVQRELTPQQPVSKRARKTTTTPNAKSGELRRSVSLGNGGASGQLMLSESKAARTTLRIWLEGFPSASAPTTLEDCDNVDSLVDFIVQSWEWSFDGKAFHYAIASFP